MRSVREDDVLAAARALIPGVPELRYLRELEGGHGSRSWLVEQRGGDDRSRYLVKAESDHGRLENTRHALAAAASTGVVVPRVLGASGASAELGGLAVSVFTWIEGTTYARTAPSLGRADQLCLLEDFGRTMARLHAYEPEAFSNSVSPGVVFASWSDLLDDRLAQLPARWTDVGGTFDGLARDAADLLTDLAQALRGCPIRPALVHRDLYADNVIVAGAAVAGIIDFEHTKLWDPIADFAKVEILLVDGDPEGLDAVIDGYLATSGPIPEMATRRALATGLELVWGIPFYLKHGDRSAVANWRSKLRRWLASTDACG